MMTIDTTNMCSHLQIMTFDYDDNRHNQYVFALAEEAV